MVRWEHHFSTYTSILLLYVVGFPYGMAWPQNFPYHIGICYLDLMVRSEHHIFQRILQYCSFVVGFLYGMASKFAIRYRNMLLRSYGSLGNIIIRRILQYCSFMSLVSYMVWPQNFPYHIGICYLDLMVRSEHHIFQRILQYCSFVVGFLYGMASKFAIRYRNMLFRSYGSLGNIIIQRILQYCSFMSLVSYMVWPQNLPYHIGICHLILRFARNNIFQRIVQYFFFMSLVSYMYGLEIFHTIQEITKK